MNSREHFINMLPLHEVLTIYGNDPHLHAVGAYFMSIRRA